MGQKHTSAAVSGRMGTGSCVRGTAGALRPRTPAGYLTKEIARGVPAVADTARER